MNQAKKNSKEYVVNFKGLNLGEGYQSGELSACENLSSAEAPCLTQRFGRVPVNTYTNAEAIHVKGELMVIAGGKVMYGNREIGSVNEKRKQIVNVGKFIIIYPDKLFYNTENGEFGSMDILHNATSAVFTHNTITANVAWKFKAHDAVTISGCTTFPENNQCIIVEKVEGNVLTFMDNSFKVHGEIAEGETAPTSYTEEGSLSFTRIAPDLDFICESNYRLWGCKDDYIYGSKWNDPFNFQVLDMLEDNSYNINVGTDGEWTGCAAYSSHICFFKENYIHKLYGSKPSNFQLVTTQASGVQKGCERSICTVNEILLYKGVNGVYAYSGGVPELISGRFGMRRFFDACAASDGDRYYISMHENLDWHLMVYDIGKGIWLREDDSHCIDMVNHNGYVYMLMEDGRLVAISQHMNEEVEWSATFCPFDETMNERKGYSKFHLRLELDAGSWVALDIKRDIDNEWQRVYTHQNERKRTVSIPVLPARCDSVELRLSGKGGCKIRTLIREFFTGSDV